MNETTGWPTTDWRPASEVGENSGLFLVWVRLADTGEDLGYDLAWKEDDTWMLAGLDNGPSDIVEVAYVADLLPKPAPRMDA